MFILFVQKWNQAQSFRSKASFCEHGIYPGNELKLNQGIDHPPHFPKVHNYSSNFSLFYGLPILEKVFTLGVFPTESPTTIITAFSSKHRVQPAYLI